VLEVFYHRAKFGGARISPAAGVAKNVEFFVCLSVRLAFECQSLCARFGVEEPRQISPPSVQRVAPAGRKTSKSASE